MSCVWIDDEDLCGDGLTRRRGRSSVDSLTDEQTGQARRKFASHSIQAASAAVTLMRPCSNRRWDAMMGVREDALREAAAQRLMKCNPYSASGRPAQGGIVAMVGGPDEAVATARPVLDDFAKAVVHCGPTGSGMTTKIARNLIQYGCWAVVDEAASLAARQGVSLEALLVVLRTADSDGTGTLRLLDVRAAAITVPADYADRAAALTDKDLDAATNLGASLGVPTKPVATKPVMRDATAVIANRPECIRTADEFAT